MRILFIAIAPILLAIAGNGLAQTAPFQIPPHGKTQQLLGDVDLEAPTAMAFDSKNRPYLLNNRNPETFAELRTVRDGKWVTRSLRSALPKDKLLAKRNMHAPGELVIDDADALYANLSGMLVYSPDLGETLKAYPCRGTLELRVGPNSLAAPPAICRITNSKYVDRGKKREKGMAWWAKRATFSVLLPTKNAEGLELGKPIQITENCLAAGSGGHSGGTSFAVTIGSKTHLVYAEVPKDPRRGGNPIYIATVDRDTRKVVAREFLVVAPPKLADVHARPTITVDSKGYLHVLSGSHGQPFFYMRSLKPNDITAGWTKPVETNGRQCYASIVCDGNDRLHSVFREWLPSASLGYETAAPKDYVWGKPKTLAYGSGPRGKYEYGIFYHRLFIDRNSNLYVSFTFWEQKTKQDGDYPEALIVSEDSGKSWRLARSETLVKNMGGK